jgi:hypothetical protein
MNVAIRVSGARYGFDILEVISHSPLLCFCELKCNELGRGLQIIFRDRVRSLWYPQSRVADAIRRCLSGRTVLRAACVLAHLRLSANCYIKNNITPILQMKKLAL